MVKRICQCGCGQVFKVLESSKQEYASRACIVMKMQKNGESTKSANPFYFMTKQEAFNNHQDKFKHREKKNEVAN